MDRLTGVADVGELLAHERTLDARARASEHHYGLILVNLLELRKINEAFSRDTGDQVLVEMARRIRRLRPRDCVARVEADKFAVLVEGADQDQIVVMGYEVKNELNAGTWRFAGVDTDVNVRVRVACVSGPSPVDEETNLLWEAQRVSRARDRYEVRETIRDLEGQVRLNSIKAELGKLQTNWALTISRQDPLTGALNVRGMEDVEKTLETPYALAFVDIDNLREINSVHGQNWEAGNRALLFLKDLLESVSPSGIVARWGGDEFLLCLPGYSAFQAGEVLNNILAHPENLLTLGDITVTFSGGVAMVHSKEDHASAMQRAQQCAHDAKDSGRARVIVAD